VIYTFTRKGLNKSIPDLSDHGNRKMRFSVSSIFSDLQSQKMATHLTHMDVGNAGSVRNLNRPCVAEPPNLFRGSIGFKFLSGWFSGIRKKRCFNLKDQLDSFRSDQLLFPSLTLPIGGRGWDDGKKKASKWEQGIEGIN